VSIEEEMVDETIKMCDLFRQRSSSGERALSVDGRKIGNFVLSVYIVTNVANRHYWICRILQKYEGKNTKFALFMVNGISIVENQNLPPTHQCAHTSNMVGVIGRLVHN
jgi:hypothetical protein